MRLNKKILSISIATILSCTSFLVSAASSINEIKIDDQNAIVVSGTLDVTRFGANLIFKMTDKNGEIDAVGNTNTKLDENGKVIFEFDKLLLPNGLESGVYTVTVLGEEIEYLLTTSFEHNGPDRKLTVMKKIKEAKEPVGAIITGETDGKKNAEILGIDTIAYSKFDEDGRKAFETIMATAQYELPENCDTQADINKIQVAVGEFSTKYNEAVPSGQFASAKTSTAISDWYNAYYVKLGFNAEAEVTKVLNEVKGTDDFVKRIASKNEPMTIAKIKTYLYESALLSGICEKRDSEVRDIILDFPTYFPIDKAAFDDLELTQQGEVIGKVSGVSYESPVAATNEVDRQVSIILGDDDDDDNSKGNGGSKYIPISGGGVVPSKDDASVEENVNKPQKPVFNDMNEAAWAEEAITFLYERGIVNGNPNGSFEPNSNITRAEFVKMLVAAMDISGSTADSDFSDVSSDRWYAPYVVAACEWGIVKGDENGCFYPEANITRQDMVTMMYRALGEKGREPTKKLSFTDNYTISDYAVDAVAYFSQIKVVNGFEDGSFGALKNATRAEVTTVFYNLITSIE